MDEITQARLYLNRAIPPGNNWFIEAAFPGVKDGKKIHSVRAFADADDAAGYALWLAKQPNTDVWACQSSQIATSVKTNAKGKQYLHGQRKIENAGKLRALRVDLDVKSASKPDGFETADHAVIAAVSACQKAQFPRPTMWVYSGYGVHIYWTLNEDLAPEAWKILAEAHVKMLQANGIPKFDTGCSVDIARLLRVPGTFNWKNTADPKKVALCDPKYILPYDHDVAQIRSILAPFGGAAPAPSPTTSATILPGPGSSRAVITPAVAQMIQAHQGQGSAVIMPDADEFSGGVKQAQAKPVDLPLVAKHCAVLAEQIQTRGAGAGRDLWKLALNAASFTADPAAWAHALSDGHAQYTPEETDRELAETIEYRAKKDHGWPRCASFGLHRAELCNACPHFAMGKSPFNFVPAPDDGLGELPANFERVGNTIVQHRTDPETGEVEILTAFAYGARDAYLFYSEAHGEMLGFTMVLPHAERKVELKLSAISTGGKDFTGALGRYGAMWVTRSTQEFMMAWVQKLQAEKNATSHDVPMYGWHFANGAKAGFSYAGQCHLADGTTVDTPRLLLGWERHYEPTGTYANWKQAAALLTGAKNPALNAIVAAAFAAPLVEYSGLNGAVLSAYSARSGLGKSAAMKVAQSVWGDPVSGLQSLNDTEASVMAKMGKLRNLPMYWDELRHSQHVDKFVNIAFQMSGGKEKSRSTSDMRAQAIGSWATMLTVASNESVRDIMMHNVRNTEAGVLRVFEFEVRGTPPNDPAMASRTLAMTNHNYGHAGLQYAMWLAQNHQLAGQILTSTQQWVTAKVGVKPEERYWAMTTGTLIAGAAIAKRLGIIDLDVPQLSNFLVAIYGQMRQARLAALSDYTQPEAMVSLLQEFLDYLGGRYLLVTSFVPAITAGRPKKAMEVLNANPSQITVVRAHQGRDDGRLRLSQPAFREFLRTRKITIRTVEEAMSKVFGAVECSPILGGGTSYRTPTPVSCWELDFNNAAWGKAANLLRDDTQTSPSASHGSP